MKYKSAITKADFIVTLICVILAFLNLGGLSSMGRERARRMICAVNMVRLAQANHVYANNWDERFCPPMMHNQDIWPTNLRWCNWLMNPDFRKFMGIDERQIIIGLVLPKEYQCPTNILFKQGRDSIWGVLVSYAYNVTDWAYEINCFWNNTCESPWLIGHKRTTIPRASEKINFVDSSDWWAVWPGANYVKAWDIVGQGNWEDYEAIAIWGPTLYRHNEGANFAFYDGHVQWMPKEKVFVDTDGNPTNYDEGDATGMWYSY